MTLFQEFHCSFLWLNLSEGFFHCLEKVSLVSWILLEWNTVDVDDGVCKCSDDDDDDDDDDDVDDDEDAVLL